MKEFTADTWPSDQLPNFSFYEMKCKCGCGTCFLDDEFMEMLQEVRNDLGCPLVVTSGYRCKNHPIEKKKVTPGAHSFGQAADIKWPSGGRDRKFLMELVTWAPGIGVSQSFLHIDTIYEGDTHLSRPAFWIYPPSFQSYVPSEDRRE